MPEQRPVPLSVHGFVLAGGASSRMGEDKALLRFCGRPMVEIAVEKLRGFCAEVSIAGNREDLAGLASVVPEVRAAVGPAAGVEAGLFAATQPWALFMPVDVPLVPAELLRRWAATVLAMDGVAASNLYYGRNQPAFCMLRRECLGGFSEAIEAGERRLGVLLDRASGEFFWRCDADDLYGENGPALEVRAWWFKNINMPEELAEAEAWARESGLDGA
jgi:molybdenum cofactor guanylyltransferase